MKTACIIALSVLALACSKSSRRSSDNEPRQQAQRTTESKTMSTRAMSTRDRVVAWAGAGAGVAEYRDVSVSGFELFWVSRPGPADADGGQGVAVPAGKDEILTGEAAYRAIWEKGVSDPEKLARLSLFFLERGGELLTGPRDPAHEEAGVTAPRIDGQTLHYWYLKRGINAEELLHTRLDLSSVRLTTEAVQPGVQDAVTRAETSLASQNPAMQTAAIAQLVTHCQDPRAAKLLARTAREHARADTRGEAAQALARCHDAGSVAALIHVLQNDAEASVRLRAASALGVIGDAAARPALEGALEDSDQGVRYTAKRALGKLGE